MIMASLNNPGKKEVSSSSTENIGQLKKEIEQKNKQINELQERKRLDNTNIKDLERRIKKLENERKKLEDKVRILEGQLSSVTTRVHHLEKENKNLEKKLNERQSLPSTPATVGEAYLYLGALCDRVQTMMYKYVFQFDSDPDTVAYKVKDIEKDLPIGGFVAQRRWVALQRKLKWNEERHIRAIVHCKRSRNNAAHPEALLTEESLTKSIHLLRSEGLLRGRLSLEVVEELKSMWKTLES